MAFYDRDELALKGFYKLFHELGAKAYEQAHKLIDYQNARGGRVVLSDVGRPPEQEWKSPQVAIECALNLEKKINQVGLIHYLYQVCSELHKILIMNV